MQILVKIKTSKQLYKLVFLIITTDTVSVIQKTIIFVNSCNNRIIVANHLQNLLFIYKKNNKEKIIKIFTLILELNIKEKYLKDFHNYNTKI